MFEARELTLRSRVALDRVNDVVLDFEWGLNGATLADLLGAIELARLACDADAQAVRRALEDAAAETQRLEGAPS